MLLKTITNVSAKDIPAQDIPMLILESYVQNHPGAENPGKFLALTHAEIPGDYELHLVNSKRSRHYKRAVATLPYDPVAIDTTQDDFNTLLRQRRITAEQLAPVFGYSNGESLRKSPAYQRGEIQNTVLSLARLLGASGK